LSRLARFALSCAFALLATAATAHRATAAAANPYVGTFWAVRAGADSLQDLKLTIDASGAARLLTRYPGLTRTAAGTRIYPYSEVGTWKKAKDGSIDVNFATAGQIGETGIRFNVIGDNVRLGLKLTDCILAVVRDQNHSFGTEPLLFRKSGCE
jgi:hypothetical protein